MPHQERTARIFISSTFRDMHGERDALIRRVIPELQERCRALNVRVLALDLRWGVTKEEAENGKALEICLDEIDRSRPFFVGLLGERYGWVPETYQTSDQAKFDWLKALPPKTHSITALEVIHGVLNNPAQVPHSYFYFRDPAFLADLPAEVKADFEAESPESAQKLKDLKARIWATYRDRPDNVQTYPCRFRDGIASGLEEFERLVLEDLWTDIQAQFPFEEETRTPLEVERDRHEAFMVEACRSFVGRDDTLAQLRQWIDEEVEFARPMILIGPGGSGKSTVLAKLAQTERVRRPDTLILPAFVGITQDSRDIMELHKRLIAELNEAAGLRLAIPDSMDDLKDTLAIALNRASAHRPVLGLIDAADQLADIHRAPALAWLPPFNPARVRILVSGLSGTAPDEAASVRGLPRLALASFGADHARAAVASLLAEYRKELHLDSENRDQMALLLAKADAGLPLYLQAAAHELRVHPLFETLTEKILALPEDLPGLYAHIFERLERDHGRPLVEAALCLLELSGVGLTESELIELLSASLKATLAPARWAALRRNLEDLVRGGESADSRYQPYHRVVREAIHTRYLPDAATEAVWYGLLAQAGIDSWRPDQAPNALTARAIWNLLKAGRTEQAADLALTVLDAEYNAWTANRVLLDTVSSLLGEDASMALEDWFAQATSRGLKDGNEARNRWHDWLNDQGTLHNEQARSGVGRGFYQAALHALSQALDLDPDNVGYQKDLSTGYSNLGSLIQSQGDVVGAKRYYKKSIEMRQKLMAMGPAYQSDLSISYAKLGQLVQSQGDLSSAKRYYAKSLEMTQKLVDMHPAYAGYQRDLCMICDNLGSLAQSQGDATEAKRYYERSLAMMQKLATLDSTNAGYQVDLSIIYNDLARLAQSQGAVTEAKRYYERCLEKIQRLVALYPANARYQRELSVTYGNLGSLTQSQGDAAKARWYYEKMLETMQKLVALDPSNANYQRDLSISYSKLGILAQYQANTEGAKWYYEKDCEVMQRLVALDPANAEYQRDLSVSFTNLGSLALSQAEAEEAKRYFEKSLAIRKKLVALDTANADYQRALSNCYGHLGGLAESQGDSVGATRYYKMGLEMRQKLMVRDPANVDYQQDLAVSYSKLGSLAESQGDVAGGKWYYEKSLAIMQHLAALDSANVGYQHNLSVSYSNLGSLVQSQSDTAGAMQYYQKDLEVMQKLVALDPANDGYQWDLSTSYGNLGSVAQSQGEAMRAKRYYKKSLEVMQKLAALDPTNAEYQHAVAVSQSNLGLLAKDQSDTKRAKEFFRGSFEIMQQLATLYPANAGYRIDLALSYRNFSTLCPKEEALPWLQKAKEILDDMQAKNQRHVLWQELSDLVDERLRSEPEGATS